MLSKVSFTAALATISLLATDVIAAPSVPKAVDAQLIAPVNATDFETGSDVGKRDNPLVYTYQNSNTCSGDWVRYSLGSGCWRVQDFNSFSPTNNPSCIVTAYTGDTCGGSDGFSISAFANGQCVENVAVQNDGLQFVFTASVLGVSC